MGFRGAAVDIVDDPSLKIASLRICETQIESLIASQLHQHPLIAFNATPRHTRQVLFHNSTFPNGTPINSPSPFDLLPNYLLQIFFPLVQAPHISVTGNTPHPPHLPSLLNPISHTYPSKPPTPDTQNTSNNLKNRSAKTISVQAVYPSTKEYNRIEHPKGLEDGNSLDVRCFGRNAGRGFGGAVRGFGWV